MKGLASFPMYERKELEVPHHELWSLIRLGMESKSLKAPHNLVTGDDGISIWTKEDLVLSQTCGLPFRTFLKGKVSYIGTPIYDLENCPLGYYRSIFIVNRNNKSIELKDFSDKKFAFNGYDSQSGYAAPYNHFLGLNTWFSELILSGSHRNSALMVANGKADIACIDEISWKLIKRFDKFSSSLVGIKKTNPTPALPFITVKYGKEVPYLFDILEAAIKNLSSTSSETLLLKGLKRIDLEKYYEVPNPKL